MRTNATSHKFSPSHIIKITDKLGKLDKKINMLKKLNEKINDREITNKIYLTTIKYELYINLFINYTAYKDITFYESQKIINSPYSPSPIAWKKIIDQNFLLHNAIREKHTNLIKFYTKFNPDKSKTIRIQGKHMSINDLHEEAKKKSNQKKEDQEDLKEKNKITIRAQRQYNSDKENRLLSIIEKFDLNSKNGKHQLISWTNVVPDKSISNYSKNSAISDILNKNTKKVEMNLNQKNIHYK